MALSGEVGYRSASLLQLGAVPGTGALALSLQIDYALLPQVDLAAIADLSGGVGQGPVGLSWLVLKPYWHNEGTDYAVRIAVDPASEGSLGFRQTDVAFLSTAALSPVLTSDFAIGVRRVRTGYDARLNPEVDVEMLEEVAVSSDLIDLDGRVRVVGQELHAAWGYNVLFDPGGSRVAFTLLGDFGGYTLIETGLEEAADREVLVSEERIQSGSAWLRGAVEWSRPSYQFAPFVSIPVVTWARVGDEFVRYGLRPDRARFGVSATLR